MSGGLSTPGAGPRPVRRALVWGVLVVGLLVAAVLDQAGYRAIAIHDRAHLAHIESKDWYRALRVAGYLPTWLFVALIVGLADWGRGVRDPKRRATLVAIAAAASGGVAEVLKFAAGRMRPEDTDGALRFMPLADRAGHWSDLSMPSSHAAVAFGAALMIGWLWRGTLTPMLLLAAGCGLTRVLAGAHFVSDVFAAAVLAYAVAGAVWRLDAFNNRRAGAAMGGAGLEGAERGR